MWQVCGLGRVSSLPVEVLFLEAICGKPVFPPFARLVTPLPTPHRAVGLLLGSLLCPVEVCVCPPITTLSPLLWLQRDLTVGPGAPPASSHLLTATCCPGARALQVLSGMSLFTRTKNLFGVLQESHRYYRRVETDFATMLSLPVHALSMALYLFRSFWGFLNQHIVIVKSCTYLLHFIPFWGACK